MFFFLSKEDFQCISLLRGFTGRRPYRRPYRGDLKTENHSQLFEIVEEELWKIICLDKIFYLQKFSYSWKTFLMSQICLRFVKDHLNLDLKDKGNITRPLFFFFGKRMSKLWRDPPLGIKIIKGSLSPMKVLRSHIGHGRPQGTRNYLK